MTNQILIQQLNVIQHNTTKQMGSKEMRLLLSSTIPATVAEPAAMPGCSMAMMTPSAKAVTINT
jgi:hypothetical protein